MIKTFDEKGRPGITYVQSAADEWREERKSELSQVQLQKNELQQVLRRDNRAQVEAFERHKLLSESWPPPRTRKKRALSPTAELQDQAQALDQDVQFFDRHGVSGTLTNLGRGAALISQCIKLAFEVESKRRRKDGLSWFDAPRDSPNYVSAQKWLIIEGIPRLYATFFDPDHDFGWGRDANTREPCGALINFEQAILSAFHVRPQQQESRSGSSELVSC